MEKAKRNGAQSAALSPDTLFETQRLAKVVSRQLTSVHEELARLERFVRQIPPSGDEGTYAQQGLERLRTLEKQQAELVALGNELDQNLELQLPYAERLRGLTGQHAMSDAAHSVIRPPGGITQGWDMVSTLTRAAQACASCWIGGHVL